MKLAYILFSFIIFVIVTRINKSGKYSWKEFNKHFGDLGGHVTFYDLTQQVDDEQNYKRSFRNFEFQRHFL